MGGEESISLDLEVEGAEKKTSVNPIGEIDQILS